MSIYEKRDIKIGLIACILTIVTIIVSVTIAYVAPRFGVNVYEPRMVVFVREFKNWPSDHIIFPLNWDCLSFKDEEITEVKLHIQKAIKDNATGKILPDTEEEEVIFSLTGELEEISLEDLDRTYTIANTFWLNKNSITKKILVFHYEDWWNDKDPNYEYRFTTNEDESGRPYIFTLRYVYNGNKTGQETFIVYVYSGVDNLMTLAEMKEKYVGYNETHGQWDFYELDPKYYNVY